MADLIKYEFIKRAPPGLAAELHFLIDAIDRGEVTSMVIAYTHKNEYEFIHGASVKDALELATLLQYRCLKRYEAK